MGRCRGASVGLEVTGVKILWEEGFVTPFFFFLIVLSQSGCCQVLLFLLSSGGEH